MSSAFRSWLFLATLFLVGLVLFVLCREPSSVMLAAGEWWSIHSTCPSQRNVRFNENALRGLLPSFVSDSSVVNSFVQETPDMILCHLWRAASSIFISIIQLEPTGLSVRSGVERIIDYYILSLLSIWYCYIFQMLLHFPKKMMRLFMGNLTSFTASYKNSK